jgi:peptide/nickel transport system ATP-binding protein
MTVPLQAASSLPVRGADTRPLLELRGLTVRVASGTAVVDDISLSIRAGETLGLVGASGAGKTMTALGILGLLPAGARASGQVLWRGRDLLTLDAAELRAVRGAGIALVPQDPMTALNPLQRIDRQVAEALHAHDDRIARAAARERAHSLLTKLGIPAARLAGSCYPFEGSGGMRQRALVAMAIANRPALLIADEPTTALDAVTQDAVLALLRGIQRETGAALLLIAHDLRIMAQLADRIAVMQDGRIVESACASCVTRRPRHAYTAALVAAAALDRHAPHELPGSAQPVLRVDGLTVRYPLRHAWRRTIWLHAVDDISFTLAAGETLALVGESGAGKSSLARALVRLEPAHAGRIVLAGQDITSLAGAALRTARAAIQLVFQEHQASLNPRRRCGASLAEPLVVHGRAHGAELDRRVRALLDSVGLPEHYARRYPHELSGGERQRIAIARALALEPRVLVLDEPVTSLDAIARAALLRLLAELQARTGVACVLVAHDLRLVRAVAHRVAVMRAGRIVETGTPREVSWPASRLSHPAPIMKP